jgi:hypothetical protein
MENRSLPIVLRNVGHQALPLRYYKIGTGFYAQKRENALGRAFGERSATMTPGKGQTRDLRALCSGNRAPKQKLGRSFSRRKIAGEPISTGLAPKAVAGDPDLEDVRALCSAQSTLLF